jgi:hypothetical protein
MNEMERGILPNYSSPGIEINERVTPDGIIVSIISDDYKGFVDSLLEIKDGGEKRFIKYGPNKSVIVNIINKTSSKRL